MADPQREPRARACRVRVRPAVSGAVDPGQAVARPRTGQLTDRRPRDPASSRTGHPGTGQLTDRRAHDRPARDPTGSWTRVAVDAVAAAAGLVVDVHRR